MKLSVFSVVLGSLPFRKACEYLHSMGVQAVEIGCGGYPGKAHCDPEILLSDKKAFQEFKSALSDNNLEIAALSTHGNAVHPDPAIAQSFRNDFANAVMLAEELNVDTVVTFSGCPGGCKEDRTPNWVTCPWPTDFEHVLEYQWNDVLIPYWEKTAVFARDHGVSRIAFEMHPGFCVYNPETMLRIRNAVGDTLGANVDPSHLFWQGMDPVEAIRYLGKAVYYFHAKDTHIDAMNTARNGVLDTKHYSEALTRSWVFRTVGYGHQQSVWNDIVSMLRMNGYDGYISIEHEDGLMSGSEGLSKAIRFLQQVLITEKTGEMFWA